MHTRGVSPHARARQRAATSASTAHALVPDARLLRRQRRTGRDRLEAAHQHRQEGVRRNERPEHEEKVGHVVGVYGFGHRHGHGASVSNPAPSRRPRACRAQGQPARTGSVILLEVGHQLFNRGAHDHKAADPPSVDPTTPISVPSPTGGTHAAAVRTLATFAPSSSPGP